MKVEEEKILKKELTVLEPRCTVKLRKQLTTYALAGVPADCLRVSVTFRTDAIYCIHYLLLHIPVAEGLYNVYIKAKVVELSEVQAGKFKWKKDIRGSEFEGSLGNLTILQIADAIKNYTYRITA